MGSSYDDEWESSKYDHEWDSIPMLDVGGVGKEALNYDPPELTSQQQAEGRQFFTQTAPRFALEAAGAMAPGMLPLRAAAGANLLTRMGLPVVRNLLSAVGQEGGEVVADTLGLGENPETIAQRFGDVATNTALGTGLEALAVAPTKAMNYFSPEVRAAKRARLPEAVPGALNVGKGNTAFDRAQFDTIESGADEFFRSGVLDGVDPTDVNAHGILAGRVVSQKEAALAAKQAAIDAADQEVVAQGAAGVSLTDRDIDAAVQFLGGKAGKRFTPDQIEAAKQLIKKRYSPTEYVNIYGEPVDKARAGMTGVTPTAPLKPDTLANLDTFSKEMNDAIREGGRYDATKIGAQQTGRAEAQMQGILEDVAPYELARTAAEQKIHGVVKATTGVDISPINKRISTMIAYEKALQNFRQTNAQGFAPYSKGSFIDAMRQGSISVRDVPLVGQAIAENSALERGPKMVAELKNIQRLRGAPMPRGAGDQLVNDVLIPSAVSQADNTLQSGTAGLALLQENQAPQSESAIPAGLKQPFEPPPQIPNMAVVPRNVLDVQPKIVFDLINQIAAPQDVMPLRIQFSKIMAGGDKRQVAQFLSAMSQKYPDFPLERGAITGKASEFDLGDGGRILVDDADIQAWTEAINRSPLREDEKAQRVRALLTDGSVYPMSLRLNTFEDPSQAEASLPPDDLALRHIMESTAFSPRMAGPGGTSMRAD